MASEIFMIFLHTAQALPLGSHSRMNLMVRLVPPRDREGNRSRIRGGQLASVHADHRVTFNQAVECFFSDFEIRRNKTYRDRHQLIGRTLGGRKLKIIFQTKPKNVVRIITGWPL